MLNFLSKRSQLRLFYTQLEQSGMLDGNACEIFFPASASIFVNVFAGASDFELEGSHGVTVSL